MSNRTTLTRTIRRCPASVILVLGLAFAGPVAAQGKRVSTYEPGVVYAEALAAGNEFGNKRPVGSAEACRNLCLRDRNCESWAYFTATWHQPPLRGQCLLSPFSGTPQPHAGVISGIIRVE
jgi:hypothetical protein